MQLFHFWPRDVHPVQNLLLYAKFHENPMIFLLRYGDISIFKMAADRHLEFWKFSFLITWRSPSSKSAAVYKISWKSDYFPLRYGDISIFKMAADRHLGIVLSPYETTHKVCCWPQLPVKFHVISIWSNRLEMPIWIFWIGLFGLKCLFRPPNWGFRGLWTPKCDYSPSRPQKSHSCVNPPLLSYQL